MIERCWLGSRFVNSWIFISEKSQLLKKNTWFPITNYNHLEIYIKVWVTIILESWTENGRANPSRDKNSKSHLRRRLILAFLFVITMMALKYIFVTCTGDYRFTKIYHIILHMQFNDLYLYYLLHRSRKKSESECRNAAGVRTYLLLYRGSSILDTALRGSYVLDTVLRRFTHMVSDSYKIFTRI